jgi:alkanesulfonate monooxygenase SsuD/methylene tetrahydromethanopterin reductase-like flavin-dependent oxidoreductase (luciferase family)
MQYGISIPNFGPFFDVRLLADLARDAEDAGWEGFFLWDHVYWNAFPISDPWMALTAIALRTEKVRLGTMVTPLARRRPTKLARETVTLDHLSGGRTILGVGLGVRPQEWDQLGEEVDLSVRGQMLDEALEVLTRLWRGEAPSHYGDYYTVDVHDPPGFEGPVPFDPSALQMPRIPVWVGGRWPNKRPFRRGARWDGIVPTSVRGGIYERLTPAQLRECVEYTLRHRTSAEPLEVVIGGHTEGRDPAHDREHVDSYQDAGATWWLEDLSPFALGWTWEGPWPVDVMRERIRRGPPR